MTPGPDGATEATEHLHEQIEEHRRELARTVSALHDKADVKGRVKDRVKDRAAGAEIAVADLTRFAGRTLDSVPRLFRRTADAAGDQVQKLPAPVRAPAANAAALVRRRFRVLLAVWTAIVAVTAVRWRRLHRH